MTQTHQKGAMSSIRDSVQIGGFPYVSKPDHRDGTPIKSQWDISYDEEYASFALGVTSGWIAGQAAWGLHLVGNVANYLGHAAVNPGPNTPLWLAYFQVGAPCHGYPSDPQRSSREVPPNEVRSDWLSKKYLRPAVVRNVGRGVTCKL
jgi:hypothetical protein